MIIMFYMNDWTPRAIEAAIHRTAAAASVVLITGGRGTGKSTLARVLSVRAGAAYLALKDLDVAWHARAEPEAILAPGAVAVIDDVDRVPELLGVVRREVSARPQPGRFVLLASTDLAVWGARAELAGWARLLTLWPMTRREQLGFGEAGMLDALWSGRDEDWPGLLASQAAPAEDWVEAVRRGGHPASLGLASARARQAWLADYVRDYLERDVPALSAIASVVALHRLMRAAATHLGELVNQSALARESALSQPTVYRYLRLLERSYQLVRLPGYPVARRKRPIRGPKLYWSDPAVAYHLANAGEPSAVHLENLVLLGLLAWRDSDPAARSLHYWRAATGEEVDFVAQVEGRLMPIEVTVRSRPRLEDTRYLRAFRTEHGVHARAGLLLHTGDGIGWLGPGVVAAPWWSVI